ncbi:MAG: Lrp/AsnC ligand binding domain-containing protein [Sulfolobaceae archaeon]|jgi:DNA-binding Lrp family transcriptional regulator|nr:Lrp/AsnC ligand binding domain-containing protein [Sulfolobales archaeon]MCG2883693.1 Lrp/AsnC ligand binding domain-containing protein [Sulfolobales archaeon]MCG2908335.1 Lrp/AsnC ligand binding domain-containing protein [Sulfolobales archaeon]MCQ4335583.1 Lrp/AsnC ligand binding domain-containing protein [Sulfolobales archaeon]MCQ4384804.1 Lrp/AsnC ligand binding domain-containing protein [Sulfolobales archaeon]
MPVKAYVLLVTVVGKEQDVAQSLKTIKGVIEASPVYGEYDVVAEIVTDNLEQTNKVISEIRRNPNILRTVTLISMQT